ncbi:MAG: hypothetical protein K0Q84_3214, partial [Arthrobacter sp.]|nr:hypothetical protein [Arthrobacter sp.]
MPTQASPSSHAAMTSVSQWCPR